MRVTEEQWQEMLRKRGGRPTVPPETKETVREKTALARAANPAKTLDARAKHDSKLEAAYEDYLKTLFRAGEITLYRHHPLTLKIGEDVRYTPDFFVQLKGGALELHEVKGYSKQLMQRVGMLKVKLAAEQWPFWKFVLVTRKGGAWSQQEL